MAGGAERSLKVWARPAGLGLVFSDLRVSSSQLAFSVKMGSERRAGTMWRLGEKPD